MTTRSRQPRSQRWLLNYATWIVAYPKRVLVLLAVLGALGSWGAAKLSIDSNQLHMMRPDLPEVQALERVIDMVGGAGFLVIGLRSDDPKLLREVADDLNTALSADKAHVRSVTYRLPVDFIRRNLGLFVDTADLLSAKQRIDAYLHDQVRRASPFYVELRPTPPVALHLDDLVEKYGHVGKKSLRDEYTVADDGQLLLLLIKPMWDSSELDRTDAFVRDLRRQLPGLAALHARGVTLREDYNRQTPSGKTVTYGISGAYKMFVDDSLAIADSLAPVSVLAFVAILLITIVFFRKIAPTAIVIGGMVLGTVIAMGFCWLCFGQLNMVTSILGGILMGFGVDYGIQFIYRARIELGLGKAYDVALRDALVFAGRPASVAAVVTAGSFFILITSDFKGFSQFGVLAGCGTLLIALTLFCWSPAILALIGQWDPSAPARWIGTSPLSLTNAEGVEKRIPHPRGLLMIAGVAVLLLSLAAVPWHGDSSTSHSSLSRWTRGIVFEEDTRALLPANQTSVLFQDEINDRFGTMADTVAVYTQTLEQAKEVYDELSQHPQKYDSVLPPVVSLYTFVPPPDQAAKNAKILDEWRQSWTDLNVEDLPQDQRAGADQFLQALQAKPYSINDVPAVYSSQFKELPGSKPENRGYLTFLYAKEDLRNGKAMGRFADQVHHIHCASGRTYESAGPAILYAMLARTVLRDGIWAVILAALWILAVHYLDFRSVPLAAVSVIPLVLGLVCLLGVMAMTGLSLNFMNIIILPILLGFGVSHGLYLLHRFLEGTSPWVALQSVGAAVASSTLTAVAGFGALLVASHKGLQSMGLIACMGLLLTLLASFTVLAAVLQLLHDRRTKPTPASAPPTTAPLGDAPR